MQNLSGVFCNFACSFRIMSKKGIYYTLFFVLLAVGFYYIMAYAIPGYNKKRIPPVSFIRPFSFINQDGERFTEKDVAGKVFVAEFFFTTCPGICPTMNENMKRVYDEFSREDDFLILAHTSDPDNDSAAAMKAYARKLGVDTRRWVFLTGRKDSLYTMARVSYTIDDPNNNLVSIEDQFIHSQFWALVDRDGNVRKIYDGLKDSEVNELISDTRELLEEKE